MTRCYLATPGALACGVPDSDPKKIPMTVRRLRDEEPSARDDHITPIAATVTVLSVLATTCVPLSAVMAATNADMDQPGMEASIRTALIMALVFLGIALLGTMAGVATILRKEWGRRLLLAYAVAVLGYIAVAIGLRLHYGIEGMTETAPTRSALSLHLTCVWGTFLVIAMLMVVVLRYFTRRDVRERFR